MKKSNIIKVLTDYTHLQIFILGALSGMPLFVIYVTLPAWLKSAGIDIAVITSIAIARVFYSLKLFWAPLIDCIKIPVIHRLGRRKSWMCLIAALISLIMFAYTGLTPSTAISKIYVLTILLGLASATLDIVIDAFRIDTIAKEELSIAAANTVFGYRIGGLIAGAGALYIAQDYSWNSVFLMLCIFYIIAILFILTLKEPQIDQQNFNLFSIHSWKIATIDPFADFFKRDYAVLILLAIIFYKLGDSMLGVVSMPFYMDLGFSLKEISVITKTFGIAATIFGSYIGGVIMYRCGSIKGLIFCGLAQSVTNLVYIWLNRQGYNVNALFLSITIENIGGGMGDAALVGYLSYLCNKSFSATQYALLSSAAGLFSHSIVAFGGSIVKIIGWEYYFMMTVLLAVPGLSLLLFLQKRLTLTKDS